MAGFWDGTAAGVTGALAGAGAAFIVTLVTNWVNRGAARRDAKLDSLTNFVEELQLIAMTYWRTSGRDDATERRMISSLDALSARLTVMMSLAVKRSCIEQAQALTSELYDASTGGGFQTSARSVDSARVEDIRRICGLIQGQLQNSEVSFLGSILRRRS
ncbi:hypothetical protein ACW0US_19330 [Xanthomonas euvesicatoria]